MREIAVGIVLALSFLVFQTANLCYMGILRPALPSNCCPPTKVPFVQDMNKAGEIA